MDAVDWILLAVLGVSVLLGIWRGLVREVLSLAGWVAGFWIAQAWAPEAAARLPLQGASEMLRYLAGFISVFLVVLIASVLLGWVISKLVSAVGLGVVDRLLGGVFGGLRGVVLLLTLTVVVSLTPMQSAPWWTDSPVAQSLVHGLQWLKPVLPAHFGKYLP
jgi:membrane protein required for colicin V production